MPSLTTSIFTATAPSIQPVEPKETETPTVAITPTQTLEEQYPSLSLLKELQCSLPCHLGITPGVTTEEDACEIISQLEPWLVDPSDGSCQTNRILRFGETDYYYWVDIIVENGIVQAMRFMVNVRTENLINPYFSQLLLDQVFESLGAPDEILIDPREWIDTYDFMLTYLNQRIKYNFIARSHEPNKICIYPRDWAQENTAILIHAGISSRDQAMVNPIYQIDPEKIVNYSTIEDVFGITDQEFYEQVLADPDTCFNIISD